MNEASRKLRTEDAARYAGSSGSAFAKMRCYGGGPRFIKIGRIVVYDTADLDAWLASKTFSSTSQYPASTKPAK
jgi:predicted DNA-binding transcriptional regulator AlpA